MFYRTGLALLYIIGVGFGVTAHENGRTVSKELFSSLEELSRLVDIAYCVSTTGVQEPFQCLSHCAEFPDMELITTWNTGILLSDSCGYIAVSHKAGAERIILAFRGTYSITNTIIDLSAIPQAYVPYTGEEDGPEGNTKSHTKCENCTVHAGFLKSWINTRSTILPVLSETKLKYPNYSISLVGHSLGGAVAALAGLEMKLKGMEPTVTTFGEPMIGNEEFGKFLNENFQLDEQHSPDDTHSFRRVTHINDPVPLLPLQEWGYAPHAGEIFISKPDLSPSVSDIQFCTGDKDSSCISGSEKPKVLPWLSREAQFSLSKDEKKPCSSGDVGQFGSEGSEFVQQEKCGTTSEETETTWSSSRSSSQKQTPLHARWDWSLIPARYHLWELFHAHRDYFWRIGLCVPGGDPTGFATDW